MGGMISLPHHTFFASELSAVEKFLKTALSRPWGQSRRLVVFFLQFFPRALAAFFFG